MTDTRYADEDGLRVISLQGLKVSVQRVKVTLSAGSSECRLASSPGLTLPLGVPGILTS